MEIDRRALLRGGATVVAGAALPACKPREQAAPPAPAPKPVAVQPTELPARELEEATFADLAGWLASGKETSASLVAMYRRRIEATQDRLHAVLEIDPDADEQAKQLDAERKAGKLRGPLHGLPILIKDNIDTGGKSTTTAGSLALEGSRAGHDAFVIGKLRAAGGLVLGKTNLSEWANFRGTASSSGWSGRGGQCRNPYALDRSPSGSSSGSAVATAASLCAAALGTETDGSIVSPSSCNGLVGIKPTVGLISRSGVIPIAISQDTVGPIARTVTDAAILLGAIAGPDPDDPFTKDCKPTDYTKALDPHALAGARIGVPRKNFFGNNRNVDAVMTAALAKLKELGAVLVDPAELEPGPELGAAELEVFLAEMQVAMTAYLKTRPDAPVHTLDDIVAFDNAHADRELHLFGHEWFEQAAKRKGLSEKSYLDARATCIAQSRGVIDKAMAKDHLDAFVAATSGPAWLIDPVNGDSGGGVSCSALPAIAGYPHVTVPAGAYAGLPLGLSFFGARSSEAKLIGYAFAFEQATRHRKPPRYLPTAELG